jgi:hypothetical protein
MLPWHEVDRPIESDPRLIIVALKGSVEEGLEGQW